MELSEVLAGVITALVTVITTLAGLIKFALPRMMKANSRSDNGANPSILQELRDIKALLAQMDNRDTAEYAKSEERHKAVMNTLGLLERRLP